MIRRRWGWAAGLLALALATVACGDTRDSAGPTSSAAPPSSVAMSPVVRPVLAVEDRTETFVDPSRATDAVGSTPASSSRTLPTAIVAPAAGQPGAPYPLIVFAHGRRGECAEIRKEYGFLHTRGRGYA